MKILELFTKNKPSLRWQNFYLENRLNVAELKVKELLEQNAKLKVFLKDSDKENEYLKELLQECEGKCEELQEALLECEKKCEELESQRDEAEAVFDNLSFTERARLVAYGRDDD